MGKRLEGDIGDCPKSLISVGKKSLIEKQIEILNESGIKDIAVVDFMSTSEKDWSNIIDTNLRSTFFLSQLVGGHMLKKKSGKIINISSILGITADSVTVQYGVSKSALITLTKYVAKLFFPICNSKFHYSRIRRNRLA